jgi:lipopolysaccharide/colanic/teichoic acid biosynthesis glycosyltransferase
VGKTLERICQEFEMPPLMELETPDVESFTYRFDPAHIEDQTPGWYELAKRAMDVIMASIALALLMPLLAVLGLLIKLTDGGPVLFMQTRVGRYGKQFRCYKLRSMVSGADRMKADLIRQNRHSDPRTFKMTADPRITWIGRLIRKTSLDEVPQLWNVVNGDMSLVGPRPPVPSEVVCYSDSDFRRLEVRPGLTCIWQISGRGDIPFHQQVKLDIDYIEQRCLWLDTKLMLQTIPAVISGRGAY